MKKISSSSRAAGNAPTDRSLLVKKTLPQSIAAWAQRPAAWSLLAGSLPALAMAQIAPVLPNGHTIVDGSVAVTTPEANRMVINQTSNRAILNWQGYSIGAEGYVQYMQPNSSAVTLNRVVGSDPSSILGKLSANGQVFLVNPNGVYFGANAVVDVAGIVATTMKISNEDFMAGTYRFTRDPNTREGATVTNAGTLNAGNGGYVVLAGDYAANEQGGVVNGKLGTVLLASGNALTLEMSGSNLVSYKVDEATVANLANVANAGQILVNGGRVIMTAAVAQDLAATVVNNSGLIQAQSTVEKAGEIYLTGQGGNVANSGIIDASAQAGARGGKVVIDARRAAGSTGDITGNGAVSAGQSITLTGDNINTGNLTVSKSDSNSSDDAYSITASARNGDLTIQGNVKLEVSNDQAAAISTNVTLDATRDVAVTGSISSTATGKGYYHYNWTTAGAAANTYYGSQPWTLANEGNHGISANLGIQAGGKVTVGAAIDVLATDTHNFATLGDGGYWQTIGATQHNFWRPTAAQATASVNAGGDVSIGAKASVKADGYATASYSETESWRKMVDNYNYTTGYQTVERYQNEYVDGQWEEMLTSSVTTGYQTKGGIKEPGGDRYIWEFGPYTVIHGGVVRNSPNTSSHTDSSTGTAATEMSYSGLSGVKASLDINTQGSVTLNGVDVRSTNHSESGSGEFTSAHWGKQDTAANLNSTSSSFTSSKLETDYYDKFSNQFTSADSNATVTIKAGDNQSVTLNGGEGVTYDVVSSHSRRAATNNTQASATMEITAGAVDGVSGAGRITINGPVRVEGADDAEVSLTVRNYDGDIVQAETGAAIQVKNNYLGGDARAAFTSDAGQVMLDDVAVNAGRSAYLEAKANQDMELTGTASVQGSVQGQVDLISVNGGVNTTGAVHANAGQIAHVGINAGQEATIGAAINATGGQTAQVAIVAGEDAALGAGISANAGNQATISVTSQRGDVTSNAALTATATGLGGQANAVLSGATSLKVDGNVSAKAANGNASVLLSTTGGAEAAISQGAASTVSAVGSTAMITANAGALGIDGNLSAIGNVAAFVNITASDALEADGDVLASASDAGYSGITLTAGVGGAAQGSDSVISAQGGTASMQVSGSAFTLDGALQVQAVSGPANLNVTGGSGSVHDFTVTSLQGSANAMISATNGTLTADGVGAVFSAGSILPLLRTPAPMAGAALTLSSSGNLDTREATLSVTNTGVASDALASATLTATDGWAKVGKVDITTQGTGTAQLIANGGAGLAVTGPLTSTASNGSASIDLQSNSDDLTISQAVTATGRTSATVDVTANGLLTTDADITVSATEGQAQVWLSSETDKVVLNGNVNVEGGWQGGVRVGAAQGIDVNGNILAGADDYAEVALTSMELARMAPAVGGNITQGADSTIRATGASANVEIVASGFTLAGKVEALASEGSATLNVQGDAGSIHDFTAQSTAGSVSATIAANNGDLTLDGTGVVSSAGSYRPTLTRDSGGTGAELRLSANGNLDASVAQLSVDYTDTDAGWAMADVHASGPVTLGQTSVAGQGEGEARLNVSSGGDMTVVGPLAVSAAEGYVEISLTSYGGKLAIDGSVAATSGYVANVHAMATGGIEVNGDVTAKGDESAMVRLGTGGALGFGYVPSAKSDIMQAAGSTIRAEGAEASVLVDAANFELAGKTEVQATIGQATLNVQGDAGSVHDFTVTSTEGSAIADIVTREGKLTANGSGTVSANADGDAARLTLSAGGDLDTSNAVLSVQNASTGSNAGAGLGQIASGAAQLGQAEAHTLGGGSAFLVAIGQTGLAADNDLSASSASGMAQLMLLSAGTLTVDGDLHAQATAGSDAGVNIMAADAIQVHGDIAATAAGSANVVLTTLGVGLVGIMPVADGSVTQAAGSITQAAGSTIRAEGDSASVNVTTSAFALGGKVAALATDGQASLNVQGDTGSVHDFTATSTGTYASATLTASNGTLTADGTGVVSGAGASLPMLRMPAPMAAAALTLSSSGNLDTREATLSVTNTGTASDALASATLTATDGWVKVGRVDVATAGTGLAQLDVSGQTGLAVTGPLSARAANGSAEVNLLSVNDNLTVGQAVIASGNTGATVDVAAKGLLAIDSDIVASAGNNGNATVELRSGDTMSVEGSITAGAGGSATVDLLSGGALRADGIIAAKAGAAGEAAVNLVTTGGAGAAIVQGKDGTLRAEGGKAALVVKAGGQTVDSGNAASATLDGMLVAKAGSGSATLSVEAATASVNGFAVSSGADAAEAKFTAANGNLALHGNGKVQGYADRADGASLVLSSAGSLDTGNASLTVANLGSGTSAGAQALLSANGGQAQLGLVEVAGNGGGKSVLMANAVATLTTSGSLNAVSAGNGGALVQLRTSGATDQGGMIAQGAGTVIRAAASGAEGDAMVDIQAGACCNSEVTLDGQVESVTAGNGNASVAARGNRVTVNQVRTAAIGSGNALLELAAPTEVTVNGGLDVQAADAGQRADLKLIADSLVYPGNAALSKGNGHVQLASFDTRRIIGVDSDRDFDAKMETNYAPALLNKFVGNQAEIVFGGTYDRSAWISGDTGASCVPGMDTWTSATQHTGNIHVAGNGHLDLGDVRMNFDTTGTTYYHDKNMSPWSVPAGRLAIFVARPNIDRYLDRTDNTLHSMTRGLENAAGFQPGSEEAGFQPGASAPGFAPVDGTTLVQGGIFRAGDGVNTGAADSADPTGADANDAPTEEEKKGKKR